MDTNRPCFRRKGRFPCGPQRTTTNLSTPAPHDSCNRKLGVAPTPRPETASSSNRANSHSSCHADSRSSCLAELRVVTAPTAATEPTAAPFRWARDSCSSRADAAPASYGPSSFLQCLANCGSWSRDCSRCCCCCCLARSCRCWREDEVHCASPDSTEHWPVQPDCWPFRQPTVDAARCARYSPDSRQAPVRAVDIALRRRSTVRPRRRGLTSAEAGGTCRRRRAGHDIAVRRRSRRNRACCCTPS